MTEIIELNGKKYIEYEGEHHCNSFELNNKELLTDKFNIMGVGDVHLDKSFNHVKIGVEFLQKVVNILKELEIDSATIAVSKEYPLLIGRINKENNLLSGFLIAPRRDDLE